MPNNTPRTNREIQVERRGGGKKRGNDLQPRYVKKAALRYRIVDSQIKFLHPFGVASQRIHACRKIDAFSPSRCWSHSGLSSDRAADLCGRDNSMVAGSLVAIRLSLFSRIKIVWPRVVRCGTAIRLTDRGHCRRRWNAG